MLEDVGGDHSVEAMAARAHMSPRHFARAFRAETGVTPGPLRGARAARGGSPAAGGHRRADRGDRAGCGFGTAETMRRAFLRALGVAPAEYRRRFQRGDGHARAAA